MTLEAMRARRDALDAQIEKLRGERDSLSVSIRNDESRAWVAVNGITLDRVQLSVGEDLPWFGYLCTFETWLRAQKALRPYAEWNGRIYLTTDLLTGRLVSTPGLIEHVEARR